MEFCDVVLPPGAKDASSHVLAARGSEGYNPNKRESLLIKEPPGHRPIVTPVAVVVLTDKVLAKGAVYP